MIRESNIVVQKISFRCLGLERTGLLGMFLFVSPNLLSVLSNFILGAPFLENWMDNVEKDSAADVKERNQQDQMKKGKAWMRVNKDEIKSDWMFLTIKEGYRYHET